MDSVKASRTTLAMAMKAFQDWCHQNSKNKGFWDEKVLGRQHDNFDPIGRPIHLPWNFGEKIALIHTEPSEALEKYRKTLGKGLDEEPDEHCPEFGAIEIELADTIIRCFDLAGKMGYDLGKAMVAKMEFNESRPYKHNKGL